MASYQRPNFGGDFSSIIKRAALGIALLIAAAIVFSSCVARVDAAHVGIRVKLAGTSRGVDDIPIVTGWVFYNPLAEQLVMFPTSVQNVVWTRDPHEGRPQDESITFSSQEGVNVNADVGLSFHIDASHAPHIYLRFRKSDLLDLADGYIRNAVREKFSIVASKMPVQEIYGAGKGKLVADVTKDLQDQLSQDGIVIDQLTINGALRLPENVAAAINRAMEATQQAIQAENKVRQVKAEAEQAVTAAEGEAAAARARAHGEADARLITSKAEARANIILRYSTSASVLQYRALERWNGKLPVMNGGALPMLTFDTSKIGKGEDFDEKKLREMFGEDEEKPVEGAKAEPAQGETGKKDAAKPSAPTPAPAK